MVPSITDCSPTPLIAVSFANNVVLRHGWSQLLWSRNCADCSPVLFRLQSATVSVERSFSASLVTSSKSIKCERPSIREAKPWFDVEHIRDLLRFKTVAENLDVLAEIAQELKTHHFQVINPDLDKLLKPKGRGWRMVAPDLRAPNGQIIEYQIMPKEMQEAGKIEHATYKQWREKDVAKMTNDELWKLDELDLAANKLYNQAWQTYLKRTGQTENHIKQVIDETRNRLKQQQEGR